MPYYYQIVVNCFINIAEPFYDSVRHKHMFFLIRVEKILLLEKTKVCINVEPMIDSYYSVCNEWTKECMYRYGTF